MSIDKVELDNIVEYKDPFIYFNLRGKAKYIGRDLVELVPYLNALVNGKMQNSPKDEHGRYMIDENSTTFFYVIDKYREWLQLGQPKSLATQYSSSLRGLPVSLAQRMSFEPEFVNALNSTTIKEYTEDDLYKCYYCNQIFARNERSSMKECTYHKDGCTCRSNSYSKCSRLPYHSETPIAIADEPKKT